MPSRYEFLILLHQLLQPRGYLEVGVQLGGSLSLAQCPAIGIDPNPLVSATGQQQIFTMTSDQFFEAAGAIDYAEAAHGLFIPPNVKNAASVQIPLDLVFLDGSHLFEDTLRDFMNVERYANRNTVVVFDDVLPYSAEIGIRHQPPGDWCGDVWKITEILQEYRPDLQIMLVDSWPVGALVVWDLKPGDTDLQDNYDAILADWLQETPPYDDVITRLYAVPVGEALERLRNR